jgi:hypothetical protein
MSAVQSQISAFESVVLALVGAFFLVRVLVLVFVGEIDLVTGRPGALADLAEQAVYILVTLALAANAQAIGRAFGALATADKSALISGDVTRLGVLMAPAAHLAAALAANLVIAMTLVAVAYIALKGQLANMLSSSEGLARSILGVVTALALFGLGLLALLIGRSLLLH